MGIVMITFRIMPESAGDDLEKMVSEIRKLGGQNIEEEPIAFGLKAIRTVFMVPDGEGGSEKLENALRSIEGVGEVEAVEVSRTLL